MGTTDRGPIRELTPIEAGMLESVVAANYQAVVEGLRRAAIDEAVFALCFTYSQLPHELELNPVAVCTSSRRRELMAQGSTPWERYGIVWIPGEHLLVECPSPVEFDPDYARLEREVSEALEMDAAPEPPAVVAWEVARRFNQAPPPLRLDDPFVAYVFDIDEWDMLFEQMRDLVPSAVREALRAEGLYADRLEDLVGFPDRG